MLIPSLFLASTYPLLVFSTSFKMDFLSSGTVRTDPLMFSQTGDCLSDHVHRFYGAVSPRTMRPGVTFQDLRSAGGNTGNVEENKSLYWNPAIYKVLNQNSDKTFQIVDVWFASAYYIFRTGQAKTFPSGLKMKASDVEKLARVRAVCDGPGQCEREDAVVCVPGPVALPGPRPRSACGEPILVVCGKWSSVREDRRKDKIRYIVQIFFPRASNGGDERPYRHRRGSR